MDLPLPSTRRDYSPLSWEGYFDRQQFIEIGPDRFNVYFAGTTGPVLVLLHGAGHSALTWALCVERLRGHYRILAMDFRGHGYTETSEDSDLSCQRLTDDVANVVHTVFSEELPPLIIVGHSMGGAIAVHVALAVNSLSNIQGLVVIDVVEGTALQSLAYMQTYLHNRPSSFDSVEKAIEYVIRSGAVKNPLSARISVPPQIKASSNGRFTWRTNLFESERHWTGWFANMSQLFLSARVPKLLITAGTDRLDKTLTIAQMQGKFQLLLFYGVGHVVQEDNPDKTATALEEFVQRNKIT
eukprot:CAMPEP_0184650268 /NCGR_PEP_ID=MMETSP0308-20130426/7783_1 /TAXON_ID=38269 /ORGANISM="Gloeochaete witrockiana, Strain SAG 46.84" /LENGTH=297 /DNA_ID=CAMNT_0027083667 /DNA_START=101 /DNA_END=994 /DNA_ORIENTATION=+